MTPEEPLESLLTAAEYERSLEIHRRIEELYPTVERAKASFRGMTRPDSAIPRPPGVSPGVLTDQFVCALAIKAATTKRSIATLCQLGDGESAMALTRVLLENACLLEWLNRGEGRRRLHAYALFTSVVYERIITLFDRFRDRYQSACGELDMESDAYHRAIATHVFGNTRSDRPTWEFSRATGKRSRIRVEEMFLEIAGSEYSYEYEVLYGALGSDVVHSGPFSLTRMLAALRKRATFVLDVAASDEYCPIALAVSNIAMLLVLDTLNEYVGLGLAEVLERLKADNQTPLHTDGRAVAGGQK